MSGFTQEQVAEFYRRQGRAVPAEVEAAPVPKGWAEMVRATEHTVATALGLPTVEPSSASRRRHVAGRMNGLEARFLEEIVMPQVEAGEVLYWHFEAVKLRLATKTWLTVDFWLMLRNGKVVAPEVKGYWEDDARVKVKLAAELFPWLHIQAWTYDRKTKVWKREEF